MSHAIRVTADLVRSMPLPSPEEGGGKEERGRVLTVGGSVQLPGAVLLAGLAALRVGAGKLQVATCASVAPQLGIAAPEARVIALPETEEGEISGQALDKLGPFAEHCDTICFGPGMTDEDIASSVAAALLERGRNARFLLDAAAATGLRNRRDVLPAHGERVVLTPHFGEMAKMLGQERESIAADPLGTALNAARQLGATVVLKGHVTAIAEPGGRAWLYEGASIGIATSGSGDVLAGVIAGLLARGASPAQAAIWGVYLHAEAGNRLARSIGGLGFLAREMLDEIPRVLGTLAGNPSEGRSNAS